MATAARRYVGADASAVLLTACVLVSGVTARLVDVDEAAKVVLSELEDEIERARRPVPAKDVIATDARWRASIARLPASNGVWSSEGDRLRRWAAQSNVTITGTFSTRDYSARTYRKTDVTFCLAGEPDAIEGLMERVNARRRELGRVAHVTREPSAEGADIIFHLFASEPIEPEALAGDGVCDSFVWSLPLRSEVASVCREWREARPVLEQIARHDAVLADLARREAILAEVEDP